MLSTVKDLATLFGMVVSPWKRWRGRHDASTNIISAPAEVVRRCPTASQQGYVHLVNPFWIDEAREPLCLWLKDCEFQLVEFGTKGQKPYDGLNHARKHREWLVVEISQVNSSKPSPIIAVVTSTCTALAEDRYIFKPFPRWKFRKRRSVECDQSRIAIKMLRSYEVF